MSEERDYWLDCAIDAHARGNTRLAPVIAAIASDGARMVVWGLGTTEAAAEADARAQDFGGAEFEPESYVFRVLDAERCARIRAGDVEAGDLV